MKHLTLSTTFSKKAFELKFKYKDIRTWLICAGWMEKRKWARPKGNKAAVFIGGGLTKADKNVGITISRSYGSAAFALLLLAVMCLVRELDSRAFPLSEKKEKYSGVSKAFFLFCLIFRLYYTCIAIIMHQGREFSCMRVPECVWLRA